MTVSTEISHEEYTGNGTATRFPFRFRVLKKSHLVVSVSDADGNLSTLAVDTDYTITGVGSYNGGSVVLTDPLPDGHVMSIERSGMPVIQETDLRNQGTFFPEVHEDAFDYLTMLIQKALSFLGLALRRPSWAAKYYDAQGNKISNLGDPVADQDAATKGYADSIGIGNKSYADSLFGRTLRVPESGIDMLPSLESAEGKTIIIQNGRPVWTVPEKGTATDVLVELAKGSGLTKIGVCPDMPTLRTIEPTIGNQLIFLASHTAGRKTGGGDFYYDDSDTTTEDNDCTVIVTSSGRRWKRRGVYDVIHAEWAGVQGVKETDAPQDDAFKNLIKAAAVGSPFGPLRPNKIIKGLSNDRIRLASRHYIRGGKYNINDTIGNTGSLRALRFGIDGSFVLDGSGGFFCVQMINAYFNIVVDNSGVTLATTPTISEYALRLEALVISPDINIKASQYSGTVYYQLGKYGAATETAAVWSDLTNSLPGATNLDHATFNIESCGRAFYWKAGGAGTGHIDSVWMQNCKHQSYFFDFQDFAFTTWEDYIPVVGADDTAAGVVWEQCGGHFGKLLTGPGGRPNHSIINGSAFDIGHLFTNQGNAQGITDPAYHTGIEIYNATVHAATAQGNHPNGRVAVVGGASVLHIGSLYATFTGQVISLGNSNLVSVTDKNQCTPKVVIDSFIGQRVNNAAYVNNAYKPPFYIDSTVSEGGSLTVNNARFENFNNGFTSQDNLYIFRCDSDASGALHINNGQFPNLAYPIYCKKPDNIGGFKNNKFGNSKIYFSDGSSTTYGGSASKSDKFISYFNGIKLDRSSFTNNGITPLLYTCRVKINAASNVSIFVNDREVFYANDAGTYSFSFTLQHRDTIYADGSVDNAEISTQAISYIRQIS